MIVDMSAAAAVARHTVLYGSVLYGSTALYNCTALCVAASEFVKPMWQSSDINGLININQSHEAGNAVTPLQQVFVFVFEAVPVRRNL